MFYVMGDKKPYAVVLLIQLIYVGFYVISKAALDDGLNSFIFIFYRHAAATILLAPLALIFERKMATSLSPMILFKMFMLSLLGPTFSSNMSNVGLKYASATVASAIANSFPVITFFWALLLRMETVKLKNFSGIAKVLGVALCFSGIMVIAFYTGPHLNPLIHHHIFNLGASTGNEASNNSKVSWIKGTLFLITSNITWSLWIVLQGILLKEYSSKLLMTTLQCLFSTIQSFIIALAFERQISRWCLSFNMGLLAIAYCGFVVTGGNFYLQTWCIEKKGPVFLAISTPLAFVFTMIFSSFFLGEKTNLGSVIGGILMVGGLYGVLWGKNKDSVKCESTMEDEKEIYKEEREISSPHCLI